MSNPYDVVVLADSPVSYWPLSDPSGTTATDLASTNPGTYTGGFTLGGSGPSAAFGGSTAFNGSTGYVTVPNAAGLNITGAISLECWVKFTAVSTGSSNFPGLVAKYGSANGYFLSLHGNDGGLLANRPYFGLIKSSTEKDTGTGYAAVTTGVWYHVVATYDNVNPMVLYINGVQVVSTNNGASILGANTNALTLANWTPAGVTTFLNGSLAGCAVYNTALSAAQVIRHYQVGTNTPVLDGLGSAPSGTGGTSHTTTLTTTGNGDIVVVVSYVENNVSTAPTVTGVSGGGLTWVLRKATSDASGTCRMEVWWAYAASPLSATVITVTYSGAPDGYCLYSFGVNGCASSVAPWDTDASLPAVATSGSSGTPSVSISTTASHCLLMANAGNPANNSNTVPPTGFTQVAQPSSSSGAKGVGSGGGVKSVTSAQSSATVAWGQGMNAEYLMVVDALAADTTTNVAGPAILLAHL